MWAIDGKLFEPLRRLHRGAIEVLTEF